MTTQHPQFPFIHIPDFELRARRASHQTGDMTIPDILAIVPDEQPGSYRFVGRISAHKTRFCPRTE